MNSIDEFVAFVGDEVGLSVTADDIGRDLDQVDGWDSVLLLTLLSALERETGRPISLAAVLESPTLERIYTVAVGG
ncbi:MAG TPA: phosphopantetheine-binding protein [Pseudonocardiaceae bacterium]|jgi:acyl carrier protein|nr:phosphopantetheine-binding protein [Pseudonocardiaceae bacterium]